jgi:hypothetical protein
MKDGVISNGVSCLEHTILSHAACSEPGTAWEYNPSDKLLKFSLLNSCLARAEENLVVLQECNGKDEVPARVRLEVQAATRRCPLIPAALPVRERRGNGGSWMPKAWCKFRRPRRRNGNASPRAIFTSRPGAWAVARKWSVKNAERETRRGSEAGKRFKRGADGSVAHARPGEWRSSSCAHPWGA